MQIRKKDSSFEKSSMVRDERERPGQPPPLTAAEQRDSASELSRATYRMGASNPPCSLSSPHYFRARAHKCALEPGANFTAKKLSRPFFARVESSYDPLVAVGQEQEPFEVVT